VIGPAPTWYGNSGAQYTLVEFADYQCPPCRSACDAVINLVETSRGRVKLTFRNFPLHSIHTQADRAANAAEIARLVGKFWPMHDVLYARQAELSDSTIGTLLSRTAGISRPSARMRASASQRVAGDIADAEICGVDGTPTYLLCTPTGEVYRFNTLQDIPSYIR